MRKRNQGAVWLTALGGLLLTAACEDSLPKIEPGGPDPTVSPYITRVLDYRPAVGQFVNTMPEYETGDTQETMNQKVLDAIGHNKRGLITLGGYGGYVIVGFDHQIENKTGLCDFRVLGNSFAANGMSQDGSCEPGVILVAYDRNGNAQPDPDEWYEIAGSAHRKGESWYPTLAQAGQDTLLYRNYEITYFRPETEPSGPSDHYIRWEANQGLVRTGYKSKNIYHTQSYYPQWIQEDQLTFKGTCLPQNGMDKNQNNENQENPYFILYQFGFGYADNATNSSNQSAIDIDWAVDASGKPVKLPGIDFIKIYTGVNQENGWLGENSTEIMGVEDLHLLHQKVVSTPLYRTSIIADQP